MAKINPAKLAEAAAKPGLLFKNKKRDSKKQGQQDPIAEFPSLQQPETSQGKEKEEEVEGYR